MMFLQQGPADTAGFMLLGFAVILGTIGLYVLSLALRWRTARRDESMLSEIRPRRD